MNKALVTCVEATEGRTQEHSAIIPVLLWGDRRETHTEDSPSSRASWLMSAAADKNENLFHTGRRGTTEEAVS